MHCCIALPASKSPRRNTKLGGTMQFKDAKREHNSLLATAEKRLLIRIAEKIPQPINSDHLTALGFVAMLAAGLSYWLARWNTMGLFAVIGWLAINWFGDSLD